MRPYSNQAAVYRLCLLAGIVDPAEIVAWADSQLESLDGYDDDLANLCLVTDPTPKKILPLLKPLSHEADDWSALREVMGKLYDYLLENPGQLPYVTSFLEHQWVLHDYETPEDLRFLFGIDDLYYLAESGAYGTLESFTGSFMADLKKFKSQG